MDSLVGTEYETITAYSFCDIYNIGLERAGSVAFSKHVTHYGILSGFLYYNLASHHPGREGHHYLPRMHWAALGVWTHRTFKGIQQEL
jgi:hypothetical protein